MAIGREETDAVYDGLIAPTLRNKDVRPVRVDRIEHNEDIDDKIISEIETCDFMIADLTFARPSVYFEAGYAQRQVPVIYTARKDHLSGKADDQFGNFRVHFDLQMKNIIPWSSPKDKNFSRRLAKRVTHINAPILQERLLEEKTRQDDAEFASLSVRERTEKILAFAIRKLRVAGYSGFDPADKNLARQIDPPHGGHHRIRELQCLIPGWVSFRYPASQAFGAFVHCSPSISKQKLLELRYYLLSRPVIDLSPAYRTGGPRRIRELLLLCTTQRKITWSQIVTVFPDFRIDQDNGELTLLAGQPIPARILAGFRELYVSRSANGESRFVGRKPTRKLSVGLDVEVRSHGSQLVDRNQKRVGWIKTVPRETRIALLDASASVCRFKENLAALISRFEKS
jgi:hypothetical protein